MAEVRQPTLRDVDFQAALRAVVEGTAADTGEEFFAALVQNLARALNVHGAWIAELLEPQNRLRARAFWLGDRFVPDFEYDISGTPCERVVRDVRLVHVPERAIELFPRDADLRKMAAVSYMGIPLLDRDGRVLGNLAVLDTRPMPEEPRVQDVFRIFANRAVAELHRLHAESQARERGEKLERLVDSAMDAIVELDDARRITHANSAAGQLFACSDAELLERCFDALLTERGRDKLLRVIEEVDRRPGAQRSLWIAGGLAARRTDGQEFPAEATLSAYDLQGRRYHTLILRDVNDRLEAERRIRHLEEQTAYLREEITTLRQFDQILGTSPALLSLLKEVDQVSPANTTVLIVGETGTGKELIARAIHEGSRRRAKSLIKVNCAAIPSNLMESELFGHEKGAFTGATQQRAGRFALADGGTMFLDEIGELPLDLQSKLLRVLQEGEFEPVGSSHTRKADVRIIAATNRDLQNEVASGRFREDLFYRLNVFPIRVPPLRERGDDVTLLAGEFAQRFARELGRSIEPLDAVAQTRLRSYAWPGNIRELQNVIERAVITARSGRLDLDRALPELARLDARSLRAAPAHAERGPVHTARQMRELERANILSALDASQWRVSGAHGAAAKLGMKPSTLSSRMKALGIRRPRAGE